MNKLLPFNMPPVSKGGMMGMLSGAGGGGGSPPFWELLGRTKLASANSSIAVSGFSQRSNLMVLTHYTGTSNASTVAYSRYNSDTGSSYNVRTSVNNASDNTLASQTKLDQMAIGTTSCFGVGYISNIENQEKLLMSNFVNQNGAGTASLPALYENSGKWVNTSNQITTIDQTSATAYTYDADSEAVVLGFDSSSGGTSVWELLTRKEATGATVLFNTDTFTPKKYLYVKIFITGQTTDPLVRYGTGGSVDSGANYSLRYSYNNGTSNTWANATAIVAGIDGSASSTVEMFIVNTEDDAKLCFGQATTNALSMSTQFHNKWISAGNQIDIISVFKGATSIADAGSFIEVWGFD